MRTPRHFKENLKNKIITEEMLGSVIYSVNKRAKNYRDQEYYYYHPIYPNSAKEKKEYYYEIKEKLLSLIKPTKAHRQRIFKKEKVYSRDFKIRNEYEKQKNKDANSIVWENSFLDYYTDEVVDFYTKETPTYLYFLYYEIGDYSFHTPVTKKQLKGRKLKLEDLDEDFYTEGKDVNDLISMQFVKSLLDLVDSGDYVLEIEREIENE